MSDPLRTETSRTPEPASRAEREAKIEQLLLAGLDHYFARTIRPGDQRLDACAVPRPQSRARSRLYRTRPQRAGRASARIRGAAARRGRRRHGAATRSRPAGCSMPPWRAARCPTMYYELLSRSSGSSRVPRVHACPGGVRDAPPGARRAACRPSAHGVAWIGAQRSGAGRFIAAGVFAVSATRPNGVRWWSGRCRGVGRGPAATLQGAWKRPCCRCRVASEPALARARALVSGGKLRDALPLLESIRPTDPERGEADRLRADIQRQLIALGSPAGHSPSVIRRRARGFSR